MKRHVLAALLFAAAATPAAAYTSYVKPEEFWVTEASVEVEGSYATQFFTPSIALGDSLTVLNPEGERVSADRIAVTPNGTTELQAELARGGTYRISTGEVTGQVANLVGENGQWRVLGAGETPAADAQTTTLQTVTVADTYVTRGTANRTAVDETIGRLAIHPVTHPNQVLASDGFQVQLLFDGQPMANSAVVIYAAGDAETKLDRYVVTDAAGNATFTFDAPGQYIIAARHRADMPAGSAAAVGSYTTTLTFEALSQLYAETEIRSPQAEPERRSRTSARRRVGRQDR
ncbi:DUF4198 domain-containing protein [Candidatus Viadribacter manganicus]|uniref:DUF4198 domain-containing protein n=1 Tax=Candidatus Viadribacter manganicus TaxID=1759059 RepID=A0A1B1AG55_9PROT|nr:DUF4198 domain-containing protein [Candidatus Viadribacter manganicus]ANP45521.1 hypothetical protein ATE48_06110 [Candidatus Viadribacter manganicus]